MKKTIEETLIKYRTNGTNDEFLINPQDLWEMIKMEIRGETIAYSAKKKNMDLIEEKEYKKK